MSKTIALRRAVTQLLKETGCEIYYEKSEKNAQFPYIVYTFDSINYSFDSCDDIFLLIEIWDRGEVSSKVEEVADKVESLLNYTNKPAQTIFPTIYLESRRSVEDDDNKIKHRQIRAKIRNYYKGG